MAHLPAQPLGRHLADHRKARHRRGHKHPPLLRRFNHRPLAGQHPVARLQRKPVFLRLRTRAAGPPDGPPAAAGGQQKAVPLAGGPDGIRPGCVPLVQIHPVQHGAAAGKLRPERRVIHGYGVGAEAVIRQALGQPHAATSCSFRRMSRYSPAQRYSSRLLAAALRSGAGAALVWLRLPSCMLPTSWPFSAAS